MKKLAPAFAFLLGLTTSAQANQIMPITAACQQSTAVENFIQDEYQEVPFAQGSGVVRLQGDRYAEGRTKIYLNPEDLGFTVVIEFPQDDVHCIILMGDDFQPVISGDDA